MVFQRSERPVVIGHRGAPHEAPENTPASFAAAADAGAGWVELDARLNADEIVVVHHDPMTADGRPLISLSMPECAKAGIPSLTEVLEQLPSGLGVDVEIKNLPGEVDHDPSMAVVDVCARELAAFLGERPVMVSSFNPMVLLAATGRGLGHPLGLLTAGTPLPTGLHAALEVGCAVLCPHHTTDGLTAEGVASVHAQGLELLVWTVDDGDRARELQGHEVDAICSNDPRRIAAVLAGQVPAGMDDSHQ